jgi:hypothetical protein
VRRAPNSRRTKVTFLNGRKSDISIWWTHPFSAIAGKFPRQQRNPHRLEVTFRNADDIVGPDWRHHFRPALLANRSRQTQRLTPPTQSGDTGSCSSPSFGILAPFRTLIIKDNDGKVITGLVKKGADARAIALVRPKPDALRSVERAGALRASAQRRRPRGRGCQKRHAGVLSSNRLRQSRSAILARGALFGRLAAAKTPANNKDLHRPLRASDDLDDAFAWKEERTLSRALTLQYDKVIFILEPSEQAKAAIASSPGWHAGSRDQ